ncbi:MAG: hypothetical protein ACYSTG_05410, partial [Planctomycetota bacterium]
FMIRFLQIFVLGSLVVLLVGCDGAEKEKPIWEQVKISDLAPAQSGKRPGDQSLKTINFGVYVFEVPAENISLLDEVWRMLRMWPLQFIDYDAFCANSFSIGVGEIEMWSKIAESLEAAGAKKVPSVSLFLSDGRADDFTVATIYGEQPVSHVSAGGSMSSATVGPGRLVMRISARKIPGSRGVCYVEVHPVFSPPIITSIPHLAARAKAMELAFISAGFALKMSPGDFVLLGPEEFVSDQITLGSLFFSVPGGSLFYPKSEGGQSLRRPERKPAIRVFLIVCTSINV